MGWFSNIFKNIGSAGKAVIGGVEHVVDSGGNVIKNSVNTVGNVANNLVNKTEQLGEKAVDGVDHIADDAKGAVTGAESMLSMPLILLGGGVFALLFFTARNNQVAPSINAGANVMRAYRGG